MPLFDFNCEAHGLFEMLLTHLPDTGHYACPVCYIPAPFVWPKTVMRPDTLWAGHQIEGRGYFTSKSKLEKTMKEQHHVPVGDRTDCEGMKKMADEAAKARDAKFEKESREFMREKMAERDLIDSFGNLRPEASKPLSDVPLISIDDERVNKS